MSFDSLQVGKPMVSLLEKHGITTPTPVQKGIIPAIKEGRDVLAQSETGSGKTLSFAIPILEVSKRAEGLTTLVLVPTRELCIQVAGEFMKFSQGNHLGITSVYGGVSINTQASKMKMTNIIIATPGRLLDLMERRVVKLENIKYLVLDEADRMLDMGFIPDIERILRKVPPTRQTMLFSATVSKEIEHLSMKYLNDPVLVSFASKVKAEYLHQTYYQVSPDKRIGLLVHLLEKERDLALVFCNKKHVADKLAKKLHSQGIHAKALHGDLSQPQRERVTADFRNKRISVLIATDVAARGLHIEDITHVYNYEVPRDVESYTHRVGRTARAGKQGEAISLVSTEDDRKFFKQILFTYKGDITLKSMEGMVLPVIEQSPREKARKETEHSEGGRERRDGRRGDRPPQRDRRRSEGGDRPSRDKRRSSDDRREPSRERPKHRADHETPKKDMALIESVVTPVELPIHIEPVERKHEERPHRERTHTERPPSREGRSRPSGGDDRRYDNRPPRNRPTSETSTTREGRPMGGQERKQDDRRRDRPEGDKPRRDFKSTGDRPTRDRNKPWGETRRPFKARTSSTGEGGTSSEDRPKYRSDRSSSYGDRKSSSYGDKRSSSSYGDRKSSSYGDKRSSSSYGDRKSSSYGAKRSPRTEAGSDKLRKADDFGKTHTERHRQRDEYVKAKGESTRSTTTSSSSTLPKDRPRRRKPFEEEAAGREPRRVDIPDMKRDTSSHEPEEKKKKKNWKEMWERLISG